jgi:2-polyprenyl-3-methyl-5-hydroxy-6-metoxy-1,4-benzoquinol methylase
MNQTLEKKNDEDKISTKFQALADEMLSIMSLCQSQSERVQLAKIIRDFNYRLSLTLSANVKPGGHVDQGNGASSRQFMIDILEIIRGFMETFPMKRSFTVLDVGCGVASGTDLLASLYSNKQFGYSLQVTALDIQNSYEPYIYSTTKYIKFICDDIFKHDKNYDIVICNHVIEHTNDPVKFIKRLQLISRGIVIVSTPFKEPLLGRTKSHRHSFDEEFIKLVSPERFSIIHSPAWGAKRYPKYEMLIMEIKGLAEKNES